MFFAILLYYYPSIAHFIKSDIYIVWVRFARVRKILKSWTLRCKYIEWKSKKKKKNKEKKKENRRELNFSVVCNIRRKIVLRVRMSFTLLLFLFATLRKSTMLPSSLGLKRKTKIYENETWEHSSNFYFFCNIFIFIANF